MESFLRQQQTITILSVCVLGKLIGLYAFDNSAAAIKAWEIATDMDALISAVKAERPYMSDEDARHEARKRIDLGVLSGTELWEINIDSDMSETEAAELRTLRDEALSR